MLILVMLVYIIVLGFTNQSFNILLGTIVGEEGWSAAQKTAVSGAMALGMVWFCFIAGSAIDKISVKKVMGTALVLLAALIFFRGQAHGFVIWYATMFPHFISPVSPRRYLFGSIRTNCLLRTAAQQRQAP